MANGVCAVNAAGHGREAWAKAREGGESHPSCQRLHGARWTGDAS